MEMAAFVEHALHQSGPGQMLLVTQLTDRNGVRLPSSAADGGQLAVGHIFNEMDVVSVGCKQKPQTETTQQPPAQIPHVLPEVSQGTTGSVTQATVAKVE